MKRIFFLLFFVVPYCGICQYQLVKEVNTGLEISAITDIDRAVAYRFYDNKLVVFFEIVKDDTTYIVFNKLGIETGEIIEQDTILKPVKNFTIHDIVVTDDFWLAIGSGSYVYKKKGQTARYKAYPGFSIYFKKGYLLNKSEVLLYSIYDFHPADGKAGIYLNIFDLKTGDIVRNAILHYPPIVLSPMSNGWVLARDNNIYVFSALNDTIREYDAKFKLKRKVTLPFLIHADVTKNLLLEKTLDSTYSAERKRMDAIVAKYPKDSVRFHLDEIQSDVLEKSYTWKLMQQVRKEYAFVERTFIYNQKYAGITISRPEYSDNYRDVVIYDMKKGKIKRVFTKWQCKTNSVVKRKEDFYTINLQRFEKRYPYFYKNKAYAVTLYDPSYFTAGTEEDITEKFQKKIMKQGYSVFILKYDVIKL